MLKMTALQKSKYRLANRNRYGYFSKIDGQHPLRESTTGTSVLYEVRTRKQGRVLFFNYDLAKEMGLLSASHPAIMNSQLEESLLETFALQIINEYDLVHNLKVPEEEQRGQTCMATRYLQLQHNDKVGLTSGDGRSLWNGVWTNGKELWDVTSCGTGATCLSPAYSKTKKFIKTGDPQTSYGCGYADVTDGLCNAIYAEIFHHSKILTERTLAVIEFPGGYSVNVRAGRNLLRPSHLFLHLRQGRYSRLKQITDYYINRETSEGRLPSKLRGAKKYKAFLQRVSRDFAKAAARFERDYVFCWLDWDGDNILIDGGVIDYGSIRQFGLFHHSYRYDDVERFSTNLLEQKRKARDIVQTFAQLTDFLISKKRKPLAHFAKHKILASFEKTFKLEKTRILLEKLGFSETQVSALISKHQKTVTSFEKTFDQLERVTSTCGVINIEDGITENAVFAMTDFLRAAPKQVLKTEEWVPEWFFETSFSSYATKKDKKIFRKRYHALAKKLLATYKSLYLHLSKSFAVTSVRKTQFHFEKMALLKNPRERMTGDAIIHVGDLIKNRAKSLGPQKMSKLIDLVIAGRCPDMSKPLHKVPEDLQRLAQKIEKLVAECREGI